MRRFAKRRIAFGWFGEWGDAMIVDAAERDADEAAWQNLIASGMQRAHSLGLKEEDVPRLIAESRAEQASDAKTQSHR